MTPELVPGTLLRQANAVNQITSQIILAAAPGVAGFVIAATGPAGGCAIDAATFVISACFLLLIAAPPRRAPRGGQSPWRDFVEGVAFVRGRPLLFTVIVMASVFFFGYSGATYVGLPVLVRGPFGSGPQGLGILFSVSGVGALAGGLVGGTMPARRRGITGALLVITVGALTAAITLTHALWQAAVLLCLSGAALSWVGITYVTVVQQQTERAFMGRVMGMLMFGIYGLYPVSYGLAGWLAELAGVRALFALGGGLIIASGVLGLIVREQRGLD
jgi:hypothetical protein